MKVIALSLLIAVLLFAIVLAFQNLAVPKYLGHKNGSLAAMPDKPNAVSSQTDIIEKYVEPLPYKASREGTLAALISTLSSLGGNDLQIQESHYIYTVFTTALLHFHDDVELLLDDKTQKVHFRSQSRAGHSDMGLNRKRYEQVKELYLK